MKKTLLTALIVMLMAGFAGAVPYTPNVRPVTIGSSGEPTLQSILDAGFGAGTINAATDQSTVGAWSIGDSGNKTYGLAFYAGDQGTLGIFSLAKDTGYDILTRSDAQAGRRAVLDYNVILDVLSFNIFNANGSFYASGATVDGFGNALAFYYKDTTVPSMSYTMDTLNNGGVVKALSYLIPDGTLLQGTAKTLVGKNSLTGNDDWVIGFEDRNNGDKDFQDAVFIMTDLTPVPEPGTLLLLGAGLTGLAYLKRRKKA